MHLHLGKIERHSCIIMRPDTLIYTRMGWLRATQLETILDRPRLLWRLSLQLRRNVMSDLLTVVLVALYASEQTLLRVHFIALVAKLCCAFAAQVWASRHVTVLFVLHITRKVFLVVFDYDLHPVR